MATSTMLHRANKPPYIGNKRTVLTRERSARLKHVPCATNCVYQRFQPGQVQLPAQSPDMNFDDICSWIEVIAPHCLEDHRACDGLPVVSREIFEQSEFGGHQIQQHACTPHFAFDDVHVEIADLQTQGPG